jgi:peptidoglycan/LPS O-acetylase OafA/YrhL
MNRQIRNYIFLFSSVLTLAGAALYITDRIHAPYVFAVGAAGITVCFMTVPYKDRGFRRRRLHRINVLAGVSMIASSVFMFRERMEWVVFLLIAALLLIYTSSVSPRADE